MKNFKSCVFAFLLLSVFLSITYAEEPKLRVGLSEFEMKNDIGIGNAGVIIPEMLTVHLKNIKKYELSERIMLKKVFDEQKLALTGLIDQSTAARIGKLTGVQGLVIGSMLKIGDEITITARLINTETAEVIASGTVKFTDTRQIETYLERLAYNLSGYSSDDYSKIKNKYEMEKSAFGGRFGPAALALEESSYHPLNFDIFYQGRILDADISVFLPVSFGGIAGSLADGAGGITGLITVYPLDFLGISFGGGFVSTGYPVKTAIINKTYGGLIYGLNFGVTYRASRNFRAGVTIGFPLAGEFRYMDSSETVHFFNIRVFETSMPPRPLGFFAEYYLFGDFLLRFSLVSYGGAIGRIITVSSSVPETMESPGMTLIMLSCGYRFSF